MFTSQERPYRKPLANQLLLRTIESEHDVRRLADFNASIHAEESGIREFTDRLVMKHPDTRSEYWLFVEHEPQQRIVSSIALLPWSLSYAGVTLPSAEMGIVGTHPRFRRQGLVGELVERFNEIMSDHGFLLSHIQGIPYFYRRFGYEYAVPLEEDATVELRSIAAPPAIGDSGTYTIRPADSDDIEVLQSLYYDQTADWDLHTTRPAAVWDYVLGPSLETCVAADTYLVEEEPLHPVGYIRIGRQGFGAGLIVQECSNLPHEAFPAVFRFLLDEANRRGKPYIRLNLPSFSSAVGYAEEIGGRRVGGYQWQMRIPDPEGFLTKLIPVLNKRIAASEFARHTGSFTIGLYRDAVTLAIAGGELRSVERVPPTTRADVRIPPNLLSPLLLGDRTLAECSSFYPDVGFGPREERLFNTMFPPMRSFLYQNY